jgi:hypothetical protein
MIPHFIITATEGLEIVDIKGSILKYIKYSKEALVFGFLQSLIKGTGPNTSGINQVNSSIYKKQRPTV